MRFPAALFLLPLACLSLPAEVRLASPFTDHLVLQRDKPVPVWGIAAPGEQVAVSLSAPAGASATTAADTDGRWRVDLPALAASSVPATLRVTGSATATPIELTDVLVGEVWLCSGQSNMDFTVARTERRTFSGVKNETAELAAADHPRIRMFTADWQLANEPRDTVSGRWQVCTPDSVRDFSAVGYFFARALQRELDVPVGIVTVAFGASTAQAWIRREAIASRPELATQLAIFDEQVRAHQADAPAAEAKLAAALAKWEADAAAAKAAGVRAPRRPRNPDPVQDQHNPTVLYNGMIAPLLPYAVKGFLWYQGESITKPTELFPLWNETLIRDWRAQWGAELPFYFVQLAALDARSNSPGVRQAQAAALALPRTGMVVTLDVGDRKDVHPRDKAPVGERLALLALAHDYGREIEYSGPVATHAEATPAGAIRVLFTHATGLATSDGKSPATFELAGPDGRFVPASAEIDAATGCVTVRAEGLLAPVSVRYAWSNYPEGCNLTNSAGLPAAPFQLKSSSAHLAPNAPR